MIMTKESVESSEALSIHEKKNSKELIEMAGSLDELRGTIERHNIVLHGSSHVYTSHNLMIIVDQIKSGRLDPNLVTRADGFREKVVELYKNKKFEEIILSAKTPQELHDLIGKNEITLVGSKQTYSPEDLQGQLENVINGNLDPGDLTRACGFREKVLGFIQGKKQ